MGKTSQIGRFSQLVLWDVDDFTGHGELSHYMEKPDNEETIQMPSTPLRQTYKLRTFVQYSSSQAEGDMELDHEDHPLALDNWVLQSNNSFMKFVIQQQHDNSLQSQTQSQNLSSQQLADFKKGIKRQVTSYPTLKDERYFDSSRRSLYITAKSHGCEDVLDSDCTPTKQYIEWFEAIQVFMFSVFNTHLLTDMGKTIVRKHVHNTDAQAVWKDLQEHMSSPKESQKTELSPNIVTQTVLDDKFKVQLNNLYYTSMNNLGDFMKSLKFLNCSLHQFNSYYSRML